MIYRSFISNEEGGFIGFLIPITFAIFIVSIIHALSNVDIILHPFTLEPIFSLWIIFVGILTSLCFWFRVLVFWMVAIVLSFFATVFVWIMYVIG